MELWKKPQSTFSLESLEENESWLVESGGFYEKMGMIKIGERHSEVEGQIRILPIMKIRL